MLALETIDAPPPSPPLASLSVKVLPDRVIGKEAGLTFTRILMPPPVLLDVFPVKTLLVTSRVAAVASCCR